MNIPREANLRGIRRGHETQRRQYIRRVERFLRRELAPLVGLIPDADLLKVACRIYSKGYSVGYHADYNRRARAARKRAKESKQTV